jgi:pimeloyl-ACP methyl ester carboxylesterase
MQLENTAMPMRAARVNDLDLHYREWGAGEPLLLLHGFYGASQDFAHALDLAALGACYRVIAPDLRGHGHTHNPAPQFSHRQCALDVLALLDHLAIARVKAVGLSLGGNTLLHMATRAPERVEAMVTVSAPCYFPAQARALMAQVSEENTGEQEWRVLREKHVHGDAQVRALIRAARSFAESFDDMNFTPPLLATIRARTLLVAGDSDPFYPATMFAAMHQAIAGSSLWVVPRGGHTPVFGEQREAFERTTLAFLRAEGPR